MTNTPNLPKANSYAKPSPFTADEFWSKLLLLIRESDGRVSKQRFEEVFGIKFVQERREGESIAYYLEPGESWYYGVALSFFGKDMPGAQSDSGMIVEWGLNAFAGGGCIKQAVAAKDLQSIGWGFSFRDPYSARFDAFGKRGGMDTLHLGVVEGCVTELRLSIGR